MTCGNRSIRLRAKSNAKVKDWVAAINDAGLRPPEGWCHPHRFGSFAPPRGLTEDGSRAQWFVDGQAAFEAIASSLDNAKSEVCFSSFLTCRFHLPLLEKSQQDKSLLWVAVSYMQKGS